MQLNKKLKIESTVSISTGTKNHNKLTNLDYANSGHTGFASSEDINQIAAQLNNYETVSNVDKIKTRLTEIETKLTALKSAFVFKGKVNSFEELPTPTNENIGHVYLCLDEEYVSNGIEWICLGSDSMWAAIDELFAGIDNAWIKINELSEQIQNGGGGSSSPDGDFSQAIDELWGELDIIYYTLEDFSFVQNFNTKDSITSITNLSQMEQVPGYTVPSFGYVDGIYINTFLEEEEIRNIIWEALAQYGGEEIYLQGEQSQIVIGRNGYDYYIVVNDQQIFNNHWINKISFIEEFFSMWQIEPIPSLAKLFSTKPFGSGIFSMYKGSPVTVGNKKIYLNTTLSREEVGKIISENGYSGGCNIYFKVKEVENRLEIRHYNGEATITLMTSQETNYLFANNWYTKYEYLCGEVTAVDEGIELLSSLVSSTPFNKPSLYHKDKEKKVEVTNAIVDVNELPQLKHIPVPAGVPLHKIYINDLPPEEAETILNEEAILLSPVMYTKEKIENSMMTDDDYTALDNYAICVYPGEIRCGFTTLYATFPTGSSGYIPAGLNPYYSNVIDLQGKIFYSYDDNVNMEKYMPLIYCIENEPDPSVLYRCNKELYSYDYEDKQWRKVWGGGDRIEAIEQEIGEKANKTSIPTKTSELINDSGYLTQADSVQKTPLFVKTKSDCTDTNKVYVLSDGYIYAYKSVTKEVFTDVLQTVGYQANMRINSSGAFVAENAKGSDVTNYIPCKVGDVIRIENMDLPSTYTDGVYWCIVAGYNSSKTHLKQTTLVLDYAGYGDKVDAKEKDGQIIQFTVKESFFGSSVAYIALSAKEITSASKVYVNSTIQTINDWENTGLAYVPTDYEDRIIDLEYEVNELGGSVIPTYWESHLETKANEIRVALENAGKNKSSFLWYTDSHWLTNSRKSPKLLKYLYKHTPINKVNFGGDIINDPNEFTSENIKYAYDWKRMIKDLPNHHSVIGNHDNNHLARNDSALENMIYSFLFSSEETNDITWGGFAYYYIDNKCEQTRYLYLDSGRRGLTDDETKFVIDALTSLPSGWHVVAISHIWADCNDTAKPSEVTMNSYMQKLLNLFDAYNSRQNGSITMVSTSHSYNFTSASGKVEFCIGGHCHVDLNLSSTKGIPVIITASDTNQERSSAEDEECGVLGTITESAVFGIVCDYTSKKLSIIGIGRGGTRVITY